MVLKKGSFAIIWFGVVAVMALSCRQKLSLPGFNSQLWISDAFACQGKRNKLVPILQKIRPDLKGLSTNQIMEVLGKPDAEGLLADNQRIYYYYIQQGTQCQDKKKLSEANKFIVRFNALERVSELSFERPLLLQ